MPRFKVKIGSGPTTVLDTGAPGGTIMANSAVRRGWKFVIDIFNLGATNSQLVFIDGEFQFVPPAALNNNFNFTTGEGGINVVAGIAMPVAYNTATEDSTAALNVLLTCTNPTATATYETKLVGAIMELLA